MPKPLAEKQAIKHAQEMYAIVLEKHYRDKKKYIRKETTCNLKMYFASLSAFLSQMRLTR
uniref:Uncharacterized protein n=1 Tax=viral metagenome TaxID=1070528 RepID=A0A6M3IZG0_9ZZZZ